MSVLVRMSKDCMRLMQNLCARSNVNNLADVNPDHSHPYKYQTSELLFECLYILDRPAPNTVYLKKASRESKMN